MKVDDFIALLATWAIACVVFMLATGAPALFFLATGSPLSGGLTRADAILLVGMVSATETARRTWKSWKEWPKK